MLVASSQIENVKRRNRNLPPATLVEIEPSEYNEFSKSSIIDCNRCFKVSKQELIQKLQQQVAQEKAPMSPKILEKLRVGIIESPLIEPEIKDLMQR